MGILKVKDKDGNIVNLPAIGSSISHKWNGTKLTVTSSSGTTTTDLQGAPGKNGNDYVITSADKEEIAGMVQRSVEEGIPSYILESAEDFAHKVQSRQSGDSFTFAFLSDAHITKSRPYTITSALHAKQALQIINKRIPLDFIIHGGDYTWGEDSEDKNTTYDDFELYQELIGSAIPNVPNIHVIGNHDDLPYQPTGKRLTQSETFGIIGRKNLLANAVCNMGKNYGYVDIDNRKIRIIYLDTEDKRCLKTPDAANGEHPDNKYYFLNIHHISKEQLDFIASNALNFESKLPIKPDETDTEATKKWDEECKKELDKWSILFVSHWGINGHGYDWWKYPRIGTNADGNPIYDDFRCNIGTIGKMLEAYKRGKSFKDDIEHMNDDGTSTLKSASYDFSDRIYRVQNIFAAHGDSHNIDHELITGEVLSIGIPNVVNGRETVSRDGVKYTKTADTENGTAFTIITIDRENQKVYADCYGAGYDMEFNSNSILDMAGIMKDKYLAYPWNDVVQEDGSIKKVTRVDIYDKPGYKTTNYIPFQPGDVLRIKGISIKDDLDRINFYKSYNTASVNAPISHVTGPNSLKNQFFEVTISEDGYSCEILLSNSDSSFKNNARYLRICSSDIKDDAIITINKEITGSEVPEIPEDSTTEEPENPTPDDTNTIYYTTEGMLSKSKNIGYIKGYYLGEGGGDADAQLAIPENNATYYVTGFIPCVQNDVLRIKGITFDDALDRIALYGKDTDGNYIPLKRSSGEYDAIFALNKDENDNYIDNGLFNTYSITPNVENDIITIAFNAPTDIAAVRICASLINNNSTVTINENIGITYYTEEGILSKSNNIGYKQGYRLVDTKAGNPEDYVDTNYFVTGYIPVSKGDSIVIKGISFSSANDRLVCYTEENGTYTRLTRTSDGKTVDVILQANDSNGIARHFGTMKTETIDGASVITIRVTEGSEATSKGVEYIRICSSSINNTSVITVAQPPVLYTNEGILSESNNIGYKYGYTLVNTKNNSNDEDYIDDTHYITGYIPCVKGNTITLKNISFSESSERIVCYTEENGVYTRLSRSTESDAIIYANDDGAITGHLGTISRDIDNNTVTINVTGGTNGTTNSVEYIRICSKDINENSIITIN